MYLTNLRGRLLCPTILLVVCVDAAIARWCATPIEIGHPGARVTPLVLGPDRMPVVNDRAEAARVPELAVLSAVAHGADPDHRDVLTALLGAFAAIDPDRAALYYDVVLAVLPEAASRYLEELVTATYEYQSEYARRYFFQGRAEGEAAGRAEGEAAAVIAVLDARGVVIPDDIRIRVVGCRDLDQLDTWVRRAATASSAQDLFVEPSE